MKLGIWARPVDRDGLDYVIEADRMGVDSAWVAEAWGFDALTPLAAASAVTDQIRLGTAVAQLGSRTPALGPRNLPLTGTHANGWIGNSFFCETAGVFFYEIRAGADAVGRSFDDIELTVSVSVAFTFGAMGSADNNFYNDAFARQGWGDNVAEVQRLWLEDHRAGAAARVPIEIGLRTNLIGPPEEIRRRLLEYQSCGVDTLRIGPVGDTLDERLENLGVVAELVNDINTKSAGADTEPTGRNR